MGQIGMRSKNSGLGNHDHSTPSLGGVDLAPESCIVRDSDVAGLDPDVTSIFSVERDDANYLSIMGNDYDSTGIHFRTPLWGNQATIAVNPYLNWLVFRIGSAYFLIDGSGILHNDSDGTNGGGDHSLVMTKVTTAPISSPTDKAIIYTDDVVAGNAAIFFRNEQSEIIRMYREAALTAQDASTVDLTYGSQERDVIINNRLRISEIETALQNIGFLA
ncbi:MAG: hypothetical protein JSW62_04785 [Thermoplasmatales archaeon]|nr:MAG: hypothetical protein JSW62_04785 [Thermoplasmatales archaeon]